jgi:hypothetical protein
MSGGLKRGRIATTPPPPTPTKAERLLMTKKWSKGCMQMRRCCGVFLCCKKLLTAAEKEVCVPKGHLC